MYYYLWLTELHAIAATMGPHSGDKELKKKKRHTLVSVQPELQPEGRQGGREGKEE